MLGLEYYAMILVGFFITLHWKLSISERRVCLCSMQISLLFFICVIMWKRADFYINNCAVMSLDISSEFKYYLHTGMFRKCNEKTHLNDLMPQCICNLKQLLKLF